MGKGIKTRSVADKTIKAIDKAAVASERMKEAYIRTKDKGEHGLYAEEGSPASMRPTAFLPGLKTRPVKLSTNLTSRAAKGLRPPKRTFPR
ncbi:MAG: CHAP domain-containing protein, partial [Oscillospiraceae bacterium]